MYSVYCTYLRRLPCHHTTTTAPHHYTTMQLYNHTTIFHTITSPHLHTPHHHYSISSHSTPSHLHISHHHIFTPHTPLHYTTPPHYHAIMSCRSHSLISLKSALFEYVYKRLLLMQALLIIMIIIITQILGQKRKAAFPSIRLPSCQRISRRRSATRFGHNFKRFSNTVG